MFPQLRLLRRQLHVPMKPTAFVAMLVLCANVVRAEVVRVDVAKRADVGKSVDSDMPLSRFLPVLTVGFKRCVAFGTVNS